jgi:hypothetical protein
MIANRLRFSLSRDQREPCKRESTANSRRNFRFVTWFIVVTSGNWILRAALPDYRAVEASVNVTHHCVQLTTIHNPNVPREAVPKHFRQCFSLSTCDDPKHCLSLKKFLCGPRRSSASLRLRYPFTAETPRTAEDRRENYRIKHPGHCV